MIITNQLGRVLLLYPKQESQIGKQFFKGWQSWALECPRPVGLDWQTQRLIAPSPEMYRPIVAGLRSHRLIAIGSQVGGLLPWALITSGSSTWQVW
jgi:hypothetical protein